MIGKEAYERGRPLILGTDREDWDHDLVTSASHIGVPLAADGADAEGQGQGQGHVTKDDYPDQGK